MPSWEPQSRLYRGPASFRGGQDLSMHPREFYLPLPRGAPNPAHVVGSGAAPRATGGGGGRCTATTPLYCRKGVPLIQGTDSGPWAYLRGGCEPVGRAKICILRSHSTTRASS
jgi:hypothetical protein